MSDEIAMIPRVLSINLGINFFDEAADPVLVMNFAILEPEDGMEPRLSYHAGVEGQRVVPLAFTAADISAVLPGLIEGVTRINTIVELLTTWPEKRDEIIRNLLFRWGGHIGQDDGDGQS